MLGEDVRATSGAYAPAPYSTCTTSMFETTRPPKYVRCAPGSAPPPKPARFACAPSDTGRARACNALDAAAVAGSAGAPQPASVRQTVTDVMLLTTARPDICASLPLRDHRGHPPAAAPYRPWPGESISCAAAARARGT